ncbi:MAG: ATP-binding protein, partial [Epsilonproteobacteria bacterium]|nr:ATP-binding protein [Campylobacterota bacterium]
DKILTGNEIDDFTDKLVNHLANANIIESDKAKKFDNKKNIYLPHIEIDTIEAFLMSKYREAVLDAKEKIEKALYKTSLNSFRLTSNNDNIIDLDELKDKLIYNKALLIEMFARDGDMGIGEVFSGLDKSEKFLEQIDSYQQRILSTIIQELQSEVELFKEIQIFVDEYNRFLNYDKNLVLSSDGIFITPEKHSIDKLSSGERHLLTFLATILLMGEEQEFILLDEPEISLDIEWQEKLLSTISKLAPESQIIVASHSPSIMGNYFDESVEITLYKE